MHEVLNDQSRLDERDDDQRYGRVVKVYSDDDLDRCEYRQGEKYIKSLAITRLIIVIHESFLLRDKAVWRPSNDRGDNGLFKHNPVPQPV
jgi:hypothetical protein